MAGRKLTDGKPAELAGQVDRVLAALRELRIGVTPDEYKKANGQLFDEMDVDE